MVQRSIHAQRHDIQKPNVFPRKPSFLHGTLNQGDDVLVVKTLVAQAMQALQDVGNARPEPQNDALQYLLIIDRRVMNFGAHDADKSRRFYFPHNSAYIRLEVTLPE